MRKRENDKHPGVLNRKQMLWLPLAGPHFDYALAYTYRIVCWSWGVHCMLACVSVALCLLISKVSFYLQPVCLLFFQYYCNCLLAPRKPVPATKTRYKLPKNYLLRGGTTTTPPEVQLRVLGPHQGGFH